MKKISGGIATPRGFLASSVNCGIRKYKHDLGLLYSVVPAVSFGVFTLNKVKAAPVVISQRHIKRGISKAIIVNSGNANCCNGTSGEKNAIRMIAKVASGLNIKRAKVLVASTGVIGEVLSIKLIEKAVPGLIRGLGKRGSKGFSKAIMTTDKFPKSLAVSIKVGASVVNIGGTAKGAGMIKPNMATMLSFITTDAAINKSTLKSAFTHAVDKSFNAISVDGSTSTNDSVFIMANGMAKNKPITKNSPGYNTFCKALDYIMLELAKMIVADGEGATKLIEIEVKGAKTEKDAKVVAQAVANDPLVKTAVYGQDPNWGRIAAAVGYSGAKVDPERLDIYLGGKKALGNGRRINIAKGILRGAFKKKNVEILIDLKLGKQKTKVYTCDLTKKYVDINSKYTS